MLTSNLATRPDNQAPARPWSAPDRVSASTAGRTIDGAVWQLGVELFRVATGLHSIGVVVVRQGPAGALVSAEFGCAAHARVVWMQDVRTSLANGACGLPLRQWRPMGIGVERMQAVSVLGSDGIWGCKLFAVAGHCGYMGLQSHTLLTDAQLILLEDLSARFAQVLQDVASGANGLSDQTPDLPALVARAAPHFRLTVAEQSVLRELACGFPAKRIALRKNVSVSTVRSQIKSIYAKLDIHRISQVYARLHEVLRDQRS